MNKFILIGIPHCGKSTLGRRAAEILQIPFFDTDKTAYDKLGLENPIELFRPSVTMRFLDEQRNSIAELAELTTSAIIATGAEVALDPVCTDYIRRMGTVIHIKRKADLVLNDLKNSEGNKLVLYDVTNDREIVMQEKAVELYSDELAQYEALADLTVENNGSEDEGVEKLLDVIKAV
jgi:shikimate kinase